MKKFLVHYLAPAEAMALMSKSTPEEKSEGMKQWMDWKEKAGDKVVDFGAPLSATFRLNSDGNDSALQSEIIGYSFIQAKSLEEAKDQLRSHPHLKWTDNVAVEVFEFCEM